MVIIRGDSRFRLFLHTGLVALAYYAGAKVGLAYAIVGGAVSLVWPSSGIALVALLALGFEVAPGIVIGSFLANVSVGVPLPVAAVISAGGTVAALTAAMLLNRVARFQITLDLSPHRPGCGAQHGSECADRHNRLIRRGPAADHRVWRSLSEMVAR